MTEHLPEWEMKRYAKLWSKFKDKEFTKVEAQKVVNGDSSLPVLLSNLRKAGWIEIRMSEKDARKTIYKLKDPADTIQNLIKELNKR